MKKNWKLSKKAYELGSAKHANPNYCDKYYNKAIKYFYGNVLKNNTYRYL
jgi:argininosuccinate synthase